jgi:hypothetical protein
VSPSSLAALLAERNGVFVHFTGNPSEIARRLHARDGHTPPIAEIRELLDAYASVFATLAAAAPIITIDCTVMD